MMFPDDDTARTAAETLPAPRSSRPSGAVSVWRCDDVDAEPVRCSTLIEATGEPPLSPSAVVYGGGEQLAGAVDGIVGWSFTQAGAERLEREARGMLDRDTDNVLAALLGDDLRSCA